MFIPFFLELKAAKVPVTLREFLTLMEGMDAHIADYDVESFYFHNCLYEGVWKDNHRRRTSMIDTLDVIRTYGPDYKVIFAGDASMSPYEITMPGGSVEHWNKEAGMVWLERMTGHFRKVVWLNPVREAHWGYTQSIGLVRQLFGGRMYPLTLGGLEAAAKELSR